jgi:hypothetical protein
VAHGFGSTDLVSDVREGPDAPPTSGYRLLRQVRLAREDRKVINSRIQPNSLAIVTCATLTLCSARVQAQAPAFTIDGNVALWTMATIVKRAGGARRSSDSRSASRGLLRQ